MRFSGTSAVTACCDVIEVYPIHPAHEIEARLANEDLSYMDISAPAFTASMNALVPDFAMVPRFLISSLLVIPMPESQIVRVLFALSGTNRMNISGSDSSLSGLVSDS